eukprot:4751573-Alexandrium_andersonii.AAC.1
MARAPPHLRPCFANAVGVGRTRVIFCSTRPGCSNSGQRDRAISSQEPGSLEKTIQGLAP